MKRFPSLVMLAVLLAVALLIVCSICFTITGQQERQALVIGYHPNFGGASAVCLGVEKGFFAAHGLDVELVCFASGPPSIAALEARDVDVSFLGHGANAFLQQGKAQIIGLDSLSYAEAILVRTDSGIQTVGDLRGKTVATPFATSGENFLEMVLALEGVSRSELLCINYDVAGALSAFVAGKVDAVAIWAPYTSEAERLLAQGEVRVLADCRQYKDSMFLPMCWVSTAEVIDRKADQLQRFLAALYDSLDYRAAHLAETARLTARFLALEPDALLSDVDTAEWFTRSTLSQYVAAGDVLAWYEALDAFFLHKQTIQDPTPVSRYLRLDVIAQSLDTDAGR